MKITKRYLAVVIAAVIGVVALVCTRQRPQQWHDNAGVVWTTDYHISYLSNTDLGDSIQAVLQAVDRSASVYNQASLVSQFNAGKTVQADAILDTLFRSSVVVHGQSGGAFDPTVMPLVNAWGFGYKSGSLPTDAQIDSILAFVGLNKVGLADGRLVKSDPRVQLDFSSIAKGLACDEIGRMLQRHGVSHYMVEIGGEIVTKGVNAQRVPWKIGVTKPDDDSLSIGNELQTILNVTDKAMATSGNYRRFYYKGGKRFAHTIDPKTGYPVQHSILSATVLANDCATADAYATSFMVMGMEGTKRVLERHPELMAYLIYDDGHGNNAIWFSPSLRDKIAN